MFDVLVYNDELPVTNDWMDEHNHEFVSFQVDVTLQELVECDGIEGLNTIMDERIGVVLSGVEYYVIDHVAAGSLSADIRLQVIGQVQSH